MAEYSYLHHPQSVTRRGLVRRAYFSFHVVEQRWITQWDNILLLDRPALLSLDPIQRIQLAACYSARAGLYVTADKVSRLLEQRRKHRKVSSRAKKRNTRSLRAVEWTVGLWLELIVSRLGLVVSGRTQVRLPASAHLSLQKMWFMGTVSWLFHAQLMKQ